MRVLFLFAVMLFATVAHAADPPPHRPSFDCAKARPGVEQTICGSEVLSRLDRTMSEQFTKRLETLINAARKEWIGQQRRWLSIRDMECVAGKEQARCVEKLYRSRISELTESGFDWVSFHCSPELGRVWLSFPGDASAASAKPLSYGQKLECRLGSLDIRVERKKLTRIWVNKRLAFADNVYLTAAERQTPGNYRIVITPEVVEHCSTEFHSDRIDGELRCVPVARSDFSGPLDYVAYPPNPQEPQPGKIIVAYSAVGAWCERLIRGAEVAPPRGLTSRRWQGDPKDLENFLHGWSDVGWREAMLFEEKGQSYVLWRTRASDSDYHAMVAVGGDAGRRPICRFMTSDGTP